MNEKIDLRRIAVAVERIDRQLDVLDPTNPFEANEIERKATELRSLIALLESTEATAPRHLTLLASHR